MGRILRIMAAGQLLLGLATVVVTAHLIWRALERVEAVAVFTHLWTRLGITLSFVTVCLGGILWAVVRLAYPQSHSVTPSGTGQIPTSVPDPKDASQRMRIWRCEMGGLFRVLALVQIALGLLVFLTVCYLMWLTTSKTTVTDFYVVWFTIVVSWSVACLGGILWALTRLAYPPAPRA